MKNPVFNRSAAEACHAPLFLSSQLAVNRSGEIAGVASKRSPDCPQTEQPGLLFKFD
jgi:hypothetical protein